MIVVTFFVCGGKVATYTCHSDIMSPDDFDKIQEIKLELARNFGYAPTIDIEHVEAQAI